MSTDEFIKAQGLVKAGLDMREIDDIRQRVQTRITSVTEVRMHPSDVEALLTTRVEGATFSEEGVRRVIDNCLASAAGKPFGVPATFCGLPLAVDSSVKPGEPQLVVNLAAY